MFTFAQLTDSMQYSPPNANQEVSNTNHLGFVSAITHFVNMALSSLCRIVADKLSGQFSRYVREETVTLKYSQNIKMSMQ